MKKKMSIIYRHSKKCENKICCSSLSCWLFRRKSQSIVITWSSSCKNFNVAHYSKCIKDINTKHGILAHHDKVQFQDKGHNFETYSFGIMSLCNKTKLNRMLVSDRRVLVPLMVILSEVIFHCLIIVYHWYFWYYVIFFTVYSIKTFIYLFVIHFYKI